jgi:hypothetical protein
MKTMKFDLSRIAESKGRQGTCTKLPRRCTLLGPIVAGLFSFVAVALPAEESVVELPQGKSPDGAWLLRIKKEPKSGEASLLELVTVATGKVAGTLPVGGYPATAQAEVDNAVVLWSPDSKKCALMTRGTKRTTELQVFQVGPAGLLEIELPSSTDAAFQLLGAREGYRSERQLPVRWLDADSLLVKASGDVVKETGDKVPIYYEADVQYKVSERKIVKAALTHTEPREG